MNIEKSNHPSSQLSSIERFLFDGKNLAHDLLFLEKRGSSWIFKLQDCSPARKQTAFMFEDVYIEYEQFVLPPGEGLEFPLPLIEADSRPNDDRGSYRFCFNFSDVEYAFTSRLPNKIEQADSPNPAIVPQFQVRSNGRGIGDP